MPRRGRAVGERQPEPRVRKLDRYIFRQVLGPFLFFVLVFTGVIWLTQSLRVIDTVDTLEHSGSRDRDHHCPAGLVKDHSDTFLTGYLHHPGGHSCTGQHGHVGGDGRLLLELGLAEGQRQHGKHGWYNDDSAFETP